MIEDRVIDKRVAVAQQGMLNNKVLFSVPMDTVIWLSGSFWVPPRS